MSNAPKEEDAGRLDADAYFTKPALAFAAVQRLHADGILPARPQLVLEPSVGKGAWVRAVQDVLRPLKVEGCDILDRGEELAEAGLPASDGFEFIWADFEELDPDLYYDIIIGNPPFSRAEQHIRHALDLVDPETGVVAFLLRINLLGGIERAAGLWTDAPPSYVYVLDKRPSFRKSRSVLRNKKTGEPILTKKGELRYRTSSSDNSEYAMFVWKKKHSGSNPEIRWLKWRAPTTK